MFAKRKSIQLCHSNLPQVACFLQNSQFPSVFRIRATCKGWQAGCPQNQGSCHCRLACGGRSAPPPGARSAPFGACSQVPPLSSREVTTRRTPTARFQPVRTLSGRSRLRGDVRRRRTCRPCFSSSCPLPGVAGSDGTIRNRSPSCGTVSLWPELGRVPRRGAGGRPLQFLPELEHGCSCGPSRGR